MDSRNGAIKRVVGILKEDIIDQFHMNEVDAALQGENTFSVKNTLGERITLESRFQEHTDFLLYEIVSCTLLLTPPQDTRKQICDHPNIMRDLHETEYTCLRCGLIAKKEYFRNEKGL